MKLFELRSMLYGLRSWASAGTARDNQIDSAINMALKHLSSDFRMAFVPDDEHVVLLPEYKTSDTYAASLADRWVLEFLDADGNPYPAATDPDRWYPVTDGSWDGTMHIEIKDGDGVWHRRQTREWWLEAEGLPITAYHYYVSLDRRYEDDVGEIREIRVYQPKVYVEGDVLEVQHAKVWNGERKLVSKLAVPSAEQLNLIDYQGDTTGGTPTYLIEDGHFRMDTPNFVPVAAAAEQVQWIGEENRGTFRFCYSYVWGKADPEWQEQPAGERNVMDPTWESQPSPISAAYTHVENEAIELTLPNIDWMQWFDVTGTTRKGHSGWRKRIYVARDAVDKGAVSWHPNVESGGIFYLLAEVNGNETTFNWDGSVSPDYHRRLKKISGYYGWRVWPLPDERYELDLRVLRAPQDLVNDQDSIPVHSSAHPAFMRLVLYYGAQLDGADLKASSQYLKEYQDLLRGVRARFDNRGGGVIAPTTWGGVRGRGTNLGRHFTLGD